MALGSAFFEAVELGVPGYLHHILQGIHVGRRYGDVFVDLVGEYGGALEAD